MEQWLLLVLVGVIGHPWVAQGGHYHKIATTPAKGLIKTRTHALPQKTNITTIVLVVSRVRNGKWQDYVAKMGGDEVSAPKLCN